MLNLNKKGKVVVTCEDTGIDAVEMLLLKRRAVYDAILEHNRADFIDSSDMYFGLIEILKDTEPTVEQFQKMLE